MYSDCKCMDLFRQFTDPPHTAVNDRAVRFGRLLPVQPADFSMCIKQKAAGVLSDHQAVYSGPGGRGSHTQCHVAVRLLFLSSLCFPWLSECIFVYAFCPIPFQRDRSSLNPGNCPCSFAKARSDNQVMQYAGKENRFLTLWTVRSAEQRYRIPIPCSSKRSCMA